jgi:hypothetical protein
MAYALTYYDIPEVCTLNVFNANDIPASFLLKGNNQPTSPLTNLVGGPKQARNYYAVGIKTLTSLEGSPSEVLGCFNVHANKQLKSLKGAENTVIHESFACSETSINTLEFCPRYIGGSLIFHMTNITKLRNVHNHVLYAKHIVMTTTDIKSHILGLVLINSLDTVKHLRFRCNAASRSHAAGWLEINTHLETDRDVYLCQDNLIKAGFAEYAQL